MGKLMNWLYFFMRSFRVSSERKSWASSFMKRDMVVPLPRVAPLGSRAIEKEAVSDSHMYCSSSLCLEVTTTLSATIGRSINNYYWPHPLLITSLKLFFILLLNCTLIFSTTTCLPLLITTCHTPFNNCIPRPSSHTHPGRKNKNRHRIDQSNRSFLHSLRWQLCPRTQ